MLDEVRDRFYPALPKGWVRDLRAILLVEVEADFYSGEPGKLGLPNGGFKPRDLPF